MALQARRQRTSYDIKFFPRRSMQVRVDITKGARELLFPPISPAGTSARNALLGPPTSRW